MTLSGGRRLNSNWLNQGLTDSKIGSLTYFEGILYILYDNAQVVRGWKLETGEQVVEWLLPSTTVSEEFDRQWEEAEKRSPLKSLENRRR